MIEFNLEAKEEQEEQSRKQKERLDQVKNRLKAGMSIKEILDIYENFKTLPEEKDDE